MLNIRSLSKQFHGHQAVKDFTLHLAEGEFVTLLGPSGSGKSTVLRMIAGLEPPSSGEVEIAGRNVTLATPQSRNIGVVFQSYALFPNLSVRQNIAFPLKIRKWERAKIESRVDELLKLVGLDHRAQYLPHLLSGGERQRVALARALAFHPPLLLLDEPLSALDAKVRESLRSSLKDIQRSTGVTTLMVTHDQDEALELSDRVVVMNRGQIEQIGPPMDVYYDPQTAFTAQFIGSVNVLETTVARCSRVEEDVWDTRVSLAGYEFDWLIRTSEQLAEGARKSVYIRPESVELATLPREGFVEATVVARTFMGSGTRVTLDLRGQTINAIVVSQSGAGQLRPGDRAHVRFVDPRARSTATNGLYTGLAETTSKPSTPLVV